MAVCTGHARHYLEKRFTSSFNMKDYGTTRWLMLLALLISSAALEERLATSPNGHNLLASEMAHSVVP